MQVTEGTAGNCLLARSTGLSAQCTGKSFIAYLREVLVCSASLSVGGGSGNCLLAYLGVGLVTVC